MRHSFDTQFDTVSLVFFLFHLLCHYMSFCFLNTAIVGKYNSTTQNNGLYMLTCINVLITCFNIRNLIQYLYWRVLNTPFNFFPSASERVNLLLFFFLPSSASLPAFVILFSLHKKAEVMWRLARAGSRPPPSRADFRSLPSHANSLLQCYFFYSLALPSEYAGGAKERRSVKALTTHVCFPDKCCPVSRSNFSFIAIMSILGRRPSAHATSQSELWRGRGENTHIFAEMCSCLLRLKVALPANLNVNYLPLHVYSKQD